MFLEFERIHLSQAQSQFKTSDFNIDNHVLDAVNLALKKRWVLWEDASGLLLVWCVAGRQFRNKSLVVYINEKATRDLMAIGELERIKAIDTQPGVSV